MSKEVFGAEAAVSMVNRALANTSPSHTVYVNQVAYVNATSEIAYAQALGAQYAVGKTAADLSAQLLGNMGVSNEVLQAALTDYIAFHGEANIGIIALQLGQILAGLEGDATFGAAAKAWNQEVTNAYQYSSSSNNNTPQTGDDGAGTTSLTRFTDVLTGHEFTGYLDYNQFTGDDEQTLTDSDRLTGTAAEDDVLFAQLANENTRPTLNGIEIVSIDAKADEVTLDLSDANGVKTIINTRSNENSELTFQGLKNLVDVVLRGTNGDTHVHFNGSVVAGTADALNLTVDGAGVKAKPADVFLGTAGAHEGIETLNITASGNASVLGTVESADLTAVTIKGDQNLSIGTKADGGFDSTKIETVDASEATGNLFLNLENSFERDQTVTTGSGNDVVVTTEVEAADTFDLGEGNDRLVLTGISTTEAVKLIGVEEVEARAAGTKLNLTNAADVKLLAVAQNAAGDAGFASVTAVKSGTTVVFEGVGLDNAVSNTTVSFGDVSYNLANATGTTDVIDFKFNNAGVALGANSKVVIGDLVNTGNNVETINLAFSDLVATNTVTVDSIQDTALKALTVTADGKVDLGTGVNSLKLTSVDATGVKAGFTAEFDDLGATAAVTIKLGGSGVNNLTVGKASDGSETANKLLTVDGSAGTGNQNITISGNADVITSPVFTTVASATEAAAKASVSVLGGSGNDTITVTSTEASVNLINGGAGADTFTLTDSEGIDVVALTAGSSSGTVKDTLTGFATTVDKIDLSSFGFGALLQGLSSGAGALDGTATEFQSKAAYFDTTNTTLYVDVNGDNKFDANDLMVVLTNGTLALDGSDILWA